MSAYEHDKPVGIVVMISQLCCHVSSGIFGAGLGVALGALGAYVGASGTTTGGTGESVAAGGMLGIAGVVLVGAAMVYIVISLIGVAAGYGIMMGRKWGFILALIGSGYQFLTGILGLLSGQAQWIPGLALAGALTYYCWARLYGKLGVPPS